jgi:hypothetical protein
MPRAKKKTKKRARSSAPKRRNGTAKAHTAVQIAMPPRFELLRDRDMPLLQAVQWVRERLDEQRVPDGFDTYLEKLEEALAPRLIAMMGSEKPHVVLQVGHIVAKLRDSHTDRERSRNDMVKSAFDALGQIEGIRAQLDSESAAAGHQTAEQMNALFSDVMPQIVEAVRLQLEGSHAQDPADSACPAEV